MQYMEIPGVKIPVSRILYGTAMPPFSTNGDGNALLDAVFALGVTAFDTARVYGDSERVIGRWIEARGNRDRIVLLSKCAHPAPDGTRRVGEAEIRADFRTSIENLRTEYLDIFLLHRDDPAVPVGEIVETMNALHAEGGIGAFGGSNWTHRRVEEANEYAYKHSMVPFTVSSPNFGLAEQVRDPWGGGCVSIAGPSGTEGRNWYEKSGMPVVAYSSLGRGLFSGRVRSDRPESAGEVMDEFALKGYADPDNFERLRRCERLAGEKRRSVPQIALSWLLSQKVRTLAVVSTTKPERMRENIEAFDISLSPDELAYLAYDRAEKFVE